MHVSIYSDVSGAAFVLKIAAALSAALQLCGWQCFALLWIGRGSKTEAAASRSPRWCHWPLVNAQSEAFSMWCPLQVASHLLLCIHVCSCCHHRSPSSLVTA